MRVLKVDLEQLFVGDCQHVTVLDAFDGRDPPVIGRQKTEFAHQLSRWKFDADFLHQEFSGDGQHHFVGGIVLPEQDVALAVFGSVMNGLSHSREVSPLVALRAFFTRMSI